MQDRVPKYPGRVTLIPVQGLENTYTMKRADEPTQQGTPLNKANLLTDATATSIGLTNEATPNDAFSRIKVLIDSNTTLANSKAKIQYGSYVGTGTYGSGNRTTLSFQFQPYFVSICGKSTSENTSNAPNFASFMVRSIQVVPCFNFTNGTFDDNTPVYVLNIAWSGNTISFFSNHSPWAQLNDDGSTYYYVAIG